MQVEVVPTPIHEAEADVHAVGLCEGDELPEALRDLPGAGDVKAAFKESTLLRPDASSRVLVLGLGKPEDLDAERLRVAAAISTKQAARYQARTLAWQPKTSDRVDARDAAAAVVEGAILAGFRFDR